MPVGMMMMMKTRTRGNDSSCGPILQMGNAETEAQRDHREPKTASYSVADQGSSLRLLGSRAGL